MILKRTLKNILLLFSVIFIQTFSSQDRPMEDYSIAKKVNVSNNYNTGQPNINIPLYKIESGNIDVTSSLNYSNGLMLGEPSIVGTNWNINLFGKIIVKEPFSHLRPITNKQNNGFYTTNSNTCFLKEQNTSLTKKQMLDNPNVNINNYYPNEFYFEFLGHNGTFLSDNIGNILIQSENEDFRITFNGQKCYNIYSPIGSTIPEIIMEDTKGNKFYFGGDYNSVDINYVKNRYQYDNMSDSNGATYSTSYTAYRNINYVNAFYLKKVQLNNGRIIEAFYRNGNRNILDPFTNGGYYFGNDYSYTFPSKATLASNNLFVGKDIINNYNSTNHWNTSNSNGNSDNKTDTYYKIAILDSIKISDYGSVNFLYQDINNQLTKPFLKKIQIKSGDKTIKNIDFNYNIKDGRVFLDKTMVNQEEYSFDYYTYLNSQDRINSLGGLIRKIIYPTRGFDFFRYEQNTASKVYGYNGNNDYYLADIQNKTIPGQRLKEITTYDTNSPNFLKKKYSYSYDNGKSTGITPADRITPMGSASDPLAVYYSSDGGYYETLYNADVRYSRVSEEITNKEKNIFYFTDLVTNPDSLNVNSYASNSSASFLGLKAQYINKNIERGKLYQTNRFNSNNDLVFQENIKYKNFLNNAHPKKEIADNCLDCKITDYQFYIKANRLTDILNPQTYAGYYTAQPVMPYLPSKIVTKERTSDNSTFLETTKTIEYNDKYLYRHLNPIRVTTSSLGKSNVKNIFYPGDLLKASNCYSWNCSFTNIDKPGKQLLTYKQMIDDNINFPLLVIDKNSYNKYSLSESVYNKFGNSNKYRLASRRANKINSSFDEFNFEDTDVFETEKFEVYDNKENLIQATPKSGIPITTIWGYHQTKPIAIIEGASYSQVMQAFNLDPNDPNSYLQLEIVKKSDLDKDDSSENIFISELNNFRNKDELKDFKVTSYVYDPLIGIKTIFQSSGIIEKYKYDSLNRLEKILDKDNNIIKEFKYNYAPLPVSLTFYNEEQSKSFVRNNCGTGYDSGTYLYIVPAEVYSSTINISDANQKALDDINANGQNIANQNLECIASQCPFNVMAPLTTSGPVIYKTGFYTHFKASIRNYPVSSGWWNNGHTVGTIVGDCKPGRIVEFTFEEPPGGAFGNTPANRTWQIRIDTAGIVSAKLLSGSVGNNSYNPLNFTFQFPNI
ncbi:DUF5977 domain-containing protein [Chryseobacterium gregarium]|uniref:DUF5977 domain-containing protein n=1 Tax=Chryseobacterium gregarium TaxID=456299 RepID=UPI00042528EB|nr:DUF5977 domain-containing protein [Chryseobacterium gregarium]